MLLAIENGDNCNGFAQYQRICWSRIPVRGDRSFLEPREIPKKGRALRRAESYL